MKSRSSIISLLPEAGRQRPVLRSRKADPPSSGFPGPDPLCRALILPGRITIIPGECSLNQLSRTLRGAGSTSPLPAHRLTGRLPARRAYSSERGETRAGRNQIPLSSVFCLLPTFGLRPSIFCHLPFREYSKDSSVRKQNRSHL